MEVVSSRAHARSVVPARWPVLVRQASWTDLEAGWVLEGLWADGDAALYVCPERDLVLVGRERSEEDSGRMRLVLLDV